MNPRDLPSVDCVLRRLKNVDGLPSSVIVNEIRRVIAARREGSQADEKPIECIVENRLRALLQPSLQRVINATGVILHTNLGRAPLPGFDPIPGYSNLEYDLERGKRGKRDAHTGRLLEALLGKSAIVVNNNAAAVFLVLNELAAGQEVIVSRGELIEIGDGFRIPEIMARSGAILREVGTTNRTHLDDYRAAVNERTRLILRVHPSNFRISGFTARPDLKELAQLARERRVPLYEDLGSGCMAELGFEEPLVQDSLRAGANLVSFSGDKLLGGPQAGIIAGDEELVGRIRRNPLYRAFRVDKLILQALETTLRHILKRDWNALPALRMILTPAEVIRSRAERLVGQLNGFSLHVCEGESAIGGGSTPDQVLPTWIVELSVANPNAFEEQLRHAPVPVIARIEKDKIVFDLRTVAAEEEPDLIAAIKSAKQSRP